LAARQNRGSMSIAAKRRTGAAITAAVIAACAMLLGLALHRLVEAEKNLSNSLGENMLWLVSQVHYEDHRLALAAEAWNRGERTDEDAEHLQLRLDLAFSRLALLSEGSLGKVIAQHLGSAPL